MTRQTNIQKAIESQREKLDRMVRGAEDLTVFLKEAQKMDRLIEAYEYRVTTL
ncbi:MAG: hypothetical protein IKV59_05335 [Lachnospiraceae bacterium]|nr:hypothetical protein [Lachnospiraceae bacterium]